MIKSLVNNILRLVVNISLGLIVAFKHWIKYDINKVATFIHNSC